MVEESQTTQQDDEPACLPDLINSPSVTIEPAWAVWASALSSIRSSAARDDLGLETDRPIVMSGHQPIVFHNGILAKLIALDEASKRADAQAVWIIPDQDAVDPGVIRVPTGSRESLSVDLVELLSTGSVPAGVSVGSIKAQNIREPNDESLKGLAQWLDQYAEMETLAGQFGYATIEHASEVLGIEPPRIIFASELFDSDTMFAAVESMRSDPKRCAQSYNNAVAQYPDAGVRALNIEDGRIELPLWWCRDGEQRVAIDTDNIGSFSRDELMPRGLMMTALVRAYLADLFIHGTGGDVYDQISQDWFRDWLDIELQPKAMVTATQHLDLGFSAQEKADFKDAHAAKWQLHHARHTPVMVGDHNAQKRKDELVAQIKQLASKDPQRDVLYRQLQQLLESYRDEHQTQIAAYGLRVERSIELAKQYELASDRTWAWVFFEQEALQRLDRATRAAMS